MKKITGIIGAILVTLALGVYAADTSEASRILYLISSVETLEGARFIRNGSEYDGQSAANHLRRKLRAAGDKVRTAEDFIELCASRSSMTGEPYLIRLPGGSTVKAEAFFRERLRFLGAGKP